MKQPLIGLTPLLREDSQAIWMQPGYLNGVALGGGIPLVLPLTEDAGLLEEMAHKIDGFLFTGGPDVSPALYGQERIPACGALSLRRDAMERQLFEMVLALDKPIFAICRGIQLINALMGGTLVQDIPSRLPSESNVMHQQPRIQGAQIYDGPAHKVHIVPGSPLHTCLGKNVIDVTSLHHQGIDVLAPGLLAMAHSPAGLIEAVCAPGKQFLWAVQWHPELNWQQPDSQTLFTAFGAACKN